MSKPVHPRHVSRLVALIVAVALVAAACSGGGGDAQADPTPRPTDTAPTATSEPASAALGTTVRFTTFDGVELSGTLWGDGESNVGLVLAHMRGRDQSTWWTFAAEAARKGYQVLTFDFRGYGDSPGQRDTELDLDLEAAIQFARENGVTVTIVMGASMGGTAAINVADGLELTGVVSLSAPAEFLGLPALDIAVNVGEPLLLVAAENDQPYADAARDIAANALTSEVLILEGQQHGTNLFNDHPGLTETLLDWVAARVGG